MTRSLTAALLTRTSSWPNCFCTWAAVALADCSSVTSSSNIERDPLGFRASILASAAFAFSSDRLAMMTW